MKTIPIKITNEAPGEREAEIEIYDEIGFNPYTGTGVSAKGFADNLKAMGDVERITVRINSPGGSVWDGTAIYNALVRHPAEIVMNVDGIAASAASFIMMAGDTIRMSEAGKLMLHRASGYCEGNCADMRELAAVLEGIDGDIAGIYAARTHRTKEKFLKLMQDTTWLSADKAQEMRLIDEIVPNKKRPVAAELSPAVPKWSSEQIHTLAAMAKDILPRLAVFSVPAVGPDDEWRAGPDDPPADLNSEGDEAEESPLNVAPVVVVADVLASLQARVDSLQA